MTPELIAEVRLYLPVCFYISTLADFFGLHRGTLRRWLVRGRREDDRLAADPTAEPRQSKALFLDFCTAYKKGLAEAEMVAISAIRTAATGLPSAVRKVKKTDGQGNITEIEETAYFQGQWTAAAWILERRFPERWSLRRQEIRELQRAVHELQGRGSGFIPIKNSGF